MNFYTNEHVFSRGFEPATSNSASEELNWQPLSQESEGPLSPSKPVQTGFESGQTGYATAEDLLDTADHSTLKQMIMKLLNSTSISDSLSLGVASSSSSSSGVGVTTEVNVGGDMEHYERSITSSSGECEGRNQIKLSFDDVRLVQIHNLTYSEEVKFLSANRSSIFQRAVKSLLSTVLFSSNTNSMLKNDWSADQNLTSQKCKQPGGDFSKIIKTCVYRGHKERELQERLPFSMKFHRAL